MTRLEEYELVAAISNTHSSEGMDGDDWDMAVARSVEDALIAKNRAAPAAPVSNGLILSRFGFTGSLFMSMADGPYVRYDDVKSLVPAAPAQKSINDDGHFSALLGDMHPVSKQAVIDFVNENTVPRASIAAPAQPAPDTWTPTAENVNALPKPVRRYIHDLATNCDPQYIIRENAIKRDENEALQRMYRKAMDTLNEVRGCFHSAETEGLATALAETTDERLKDLVERRLMYALYAAEGVVDEAAQPVPESLDLASIISGALFDFMGMLTSQTEETHLSGHHDATIAVERIEQFAAKRGLTLTEANVNHWHNWLGKPEPDTSTAATHARALFNGDMVRTWYEDGEIKQEIIALADMHTKATHAQDVYKTESEIDRLRRDAERYRWLQFNVQRIVDHLYYSGTTMEFDSLIDAAMQAKGDGS